MSTKSEKTNKAICCIFPIVALLILYYYCITRCHMQFLSNDDASIHSILSGEYSGAPYPLHQYINCILSLVISGMYKAIPGVRWWYFYSHALMLIGSWLIGYSICKASLEKGITIVFAFIATLLFYFILLFFPVANILFTIVPGVLGTGAIAFLMCGNHEKKRTYIIPICILFLVAIHRIEVAKVIVCYSFFLALLYKGDKEQVKKKRIIMNRQIEEYDELFMRNDN